ncbi:MAG: radical SAM protein [Thermoplasmata archaeon]|nr:radical SAM protein [Thermoplasmata archaeon]
MDDEINIFFSDCPAIPSFHVSALGNVKIKNSVSIYLTHACNLRCKTCYLNAGEPLKNELSIKNYEKIFSEIKDLNFDMVYFLGGEPMLRKDILDIIKIAKGNDLYTSMSSNGFFIDSINAKSLKEAGLDQIQISIDSPSEEINDNIRGQGSFGKAVKAIHNLKKVNMKVSIGFTITKNFYDVETMVNFASQIGINVLNISIAEPFGRAMLYDIIPEKEKVKKAIEQIKNLKSVIKITYNGFRFYLDEKVFEKSLKFIPENYRSCPAGINRFVIDSNGNVYGCELLMENEFFEGNVLEDDLKTIWEKGFRRFKERMPNECKSCKYLRSCQGGCPARSFISGSFNSKDPLCYL